jgi:hypothetical protein
MQSREPKIRKRLKSLVKEGGQGRNRTADTRIFSSVLHAVPLVSIGIYL